LLECVNKVVIFFKEWINWISTEIIQQKPTWKHLPNSTCSTCNPKIPAWTSFSVPSRWVLEQRRWPSSRWPREEIPFRASPSKLSDQKAKCRRLSRVRKILKKNNLV
jgi:hypothetical protein